MVTGLGRRVARLHGALGLVDLDGYTARLAARLGLPVAAAVTEARRVHTLVQRDGLAGATQRLAAELGLSVAEYERRIEALRRELAAAGRGMGSGRAGRSGWGRQ